MEDTNKAPKEAAADTLRGEEPKAGTGDKAPDAKVQYTLEDLLSRRSKPQTKEPKPIDEALEALGDIELPFSNPDLRPDSILLPVPDLMHTYYSSKDYEEKFKEWKKAKAARLAAEKAESDKHDQSDESEKPKEMVTFEVQKTEVQLPRAALEGSEFFSTVLAALDAPEAKEHSIVLKDTTLADFGALVKVIDGASDLTASEWISAFELSTKWKLSSVRQAAIAHFLKLPDKPYVKKLALGKQFNSKALVKSAYLDLLVREEHMTQDELDHLGTNLVLRLASAREKAHISSWTGCCNTVDKEWHKWAHHASGVVFKDEMAKMTSPLDLVDQILASLKAGHPDLLKVGCLKLAERDKSLNVKEFTRLGNELGLKLLEARLEFRRITHQASDIRWGECSDTVKELANCLEKKFEKEFKALEEGYKASHISFNDVLSPQVKVDTGELVNSSTGVA